MFSSFYSRLREKLSPLTPHLLPRHLPSWFVGKRKIILFTANRLSIARSVMAVPIAVCLYFEQITMAFVIFILAALTDFFDGLVAKVHADLGYPHNGELGAFLDAFCDKIFFLSLMSILLFSIEYKASLLFVAIFLAICGLLLYIEITLAIIRVQDFYALRERGEKRHLKAIISGKIKFLLQMLGLGALILSYPNPFDGHWTGWVSIISFILSVHFAWKSLKHKLSARPTS